MFGDLEGLEREAITVEEAKSGIKECYIERRSLSLDWFVTYFVYKNLIVAVENIEDNYEHRKAEAETMEEILSITAGWC